MVANIPCFAPSKESAQIEGSKAFSKDFMARHRIPTAEYLNFTDYESAREYVKSISNRVVIKASGLAAGKGVVLPETLEETLESVKDIMLDRKFGEAGAEVVIEEFLEGDELSILTFSDGRTFKSLPPAQDHKRIFDGDLGPNTGGMGCYAPAKIASQSTLEEINERILRPTFDGLRKDGGYPLGKLLILQFIILIDNLQEFHLLACFLQALCSRSLDPKPSNTMLVLEIRKPKPCFP
jgi:phosphoribosylamine--glycine ligase/phosphoribosylformylglycinamidine cyclo-ligase